MNKRFVVFSALSAALAWSQVAAREWRIPSPLSYGYAYSHFPFLPPIDENECNQCWWFDYINPWMAGEFRHANNAFTNSDSTKKELLPGIFFGQDTFTIANIVSPGSVSNLVPLASVIQITPNFDYTENVAWFGLNVEKHFGCECQWHVGVRLRIPYRDIKTQLDSCCTLESSIDTLFVSNVNELVCNDDTVTNPAQQKSLIQNSFAYRLDFLSELPIAVNGTTKFVNYNDPATSGKITMAGIDVTTFNGGPVQVVSVPVGQSPKSPFALRLTDPTSETPDCPIDVTGFFASSVAGLPTLNADGSGVPTGGRAVFSMVPGFYVPLSTDVAEQQTLWVVPTAASSTPNNPATFDIVQPARAIQSAFNAIVNAAEFSVIEFLATVTEINFQTQRTSGPGDFLAELYVHRDLCSCWGDWFAEGIIGASFPTAHRDNYPNLLLLVPRGNNGHYEVKIGGFLGWQPCDWLAVKFDGFYNWALSRNETVAASFMGATVKNIGPAIKAKVSWDYFVGDLDLTFLIPCICPELGVNIGYQPYVKRQDEINFVNVTTATDLLGNVEPLDASVLEMRTKQVAHTIKGELFYQACSWQIWGGFNHAVAGKNAPVQSAWYIGADIYF